MSADRERFDDLLEFVLDGSCCDADHEEFARLVDEHPEWLRPLAEEVFVHSLLQWQDEDVSFELEHFGLQDEAIVAEAATPSEWVSTPGSRSPLPKLQPRLTAAAVLAIVASALMTWRAVPLGDVGKLAVAEVVGKNGVVWTAKSTALQKGRFVMPGRLENSAGDFTLKFRTGPTMRISGPASMMIENGMLVHLDRGQATARVPEPIKGFTIKTPVINVIDQGTEFGVVARNNGVTDVIVFDGKVDLADGISNDGPSKRLVRGEAARVDRRGGLERIMHVGRDRSGEWWTEDDPANSRQFIRSVRDNIPLDGGTDYFRFQITNQGLDDDAPAYTDHLHEWNGLTAKGLPDFLRGAEYVQTRNDYRYMPNFELTVACAKPANVYVFFDDRVPIPAWLAEQYVDTGVDIGLDEGPQEGVMDHVVAVGGGNSIDNVFSVWRRQTDGAATIVLGPQGPTGEARAMYGIAVTPLDDVEPAASAAPDSPAAADR
jgi:hypothetical protein